MNAGPELDALIAEHVMGFQRKLSDDGQFSLWVWSDGTARWFVPGYSTDIAAAFTVTERIPGLVLEDWRHEPSAPAPWAAYFTLEGGGSSWQGFGKTAAEAICRAALILRGVKA